LSLFLANELGRSLVIFILVHGLFLLFIQFLQFYINIDTKGLWVVDWWCTGKGAKEWKPTCIGVDYFNGSLQHQ